MIAQHLDPTRPSHLAEILARRSTLPVRTVTDQRRGCNRRHLCRARQPPCRDHRLRHRAAGARGWHTNASIDLTLLELRRRGLWRHAHRGHFERHRLRRRGRRARGQRRPGARCMIQDPEHGELPWACRLALAPTTVDIVAPLDRIGPILADLLAGRPCRPSRRAGSPGRISRQTCGSAMAWTSIATSRRRFCAGCNGASWRPTRDTLAGYRAIWQTHPDEYQQLVNAFLIKVTEFFRDPEVFAYLRDTVMPDLIDYARDASRARTCGSGRRAARRERRPTRWPYWWPKRWGETWNTSTCASLPLMPTPRRWPSPGTGIYPAHGARPSLRGFLCEYFTRTKALL